MGRRQGGRIAIPVARVLPFRDPATQALACDRRQRAAAPGLSVGVVIEDTVAYALLQGMKSTRGAISPVLAERGLHPGQDLMLSALWREDGITQAELAAIVRCAQRGHPGVLNDD